MIDILYSSFLIKYYPDPVTSYILLDNINLLDINETSGGSKEPSRNPQRPYQEYQIDYQQLNIKDMS